jgi:transposase
MRIGVATVRRWLRARRERNDVAPLPRGGGRKPGLNPDDDGALRQAVAEKPDRTIAELTALLVEKQNKAFSTSAVSRALARLDLVLKKVGHGKRARPT